MVINLDINNIDQLDITPNQYCLAQSIFFKNKIQFLKLRGLYSKDNYFKEDMFQLVMKGYLDNKNNDQYSINFDNCEIKGINFEVIVEDEILIEDEEELPDTGPVEVITEWDKFVKRFREAFPKGIMTGGKYVRSSTKDCSKKLKQFIKEYEFDEETIIAATEKYVSRYQMQGYKFIKTASFFVIKEKISALADECEMLSEADDGGNGNMFKSGI
jgi:hypothetical protein